MSLLDLHALADVQNDMKISTDTYVCLSAGREKKENGPQDLPLYWRITWQAESLLSMEIDSRTGAFREFEVILHKGDFCKRIKDNCRSKPCLFNGLPVFDTSLWKNPNKDGYQISKKNIHDHAISPRLYLDDTSLLIDFGTGHPTHSAVISSKIKFLFSIDKQLIGLDFYDLSQKNLKDLKSYAKKFE